MINEIIMVSISEILFDILLWVAAAILIVSFASSVSLCVLLIIRLIFRDFNNMSTILVLTGLAGLYLHIAPLFHYFESYLLNHTMYIK